MYLNGGTNHDAMENTVFKGRRFSRRLVFYVNGKEVIEENVDPEWTLLWYLRNKLNLTGTKLGCAEGGCGACTVMISKLERSTGTIVHLAVNACLTPVCAMHGLAVTTTEGIGSVRTKLHPVQERIAKAHGSQCGFCTPGIVMSMYALLRSTPKPCMKDLEVAFQGNLCRCTGYRAIIEGYKTFTEEWERNRLTSGLPQKDSSMNGVCSMGEWCCKKAFTSEPTEVFDPKGFCPYDPSQEVIFPPKLQLSAHLDEEYLKFEGKNGTWYRPTNLTELLELKEKHNDAKIVVGNTEIGVEVKFKHLSYPYLISPLLIKEMHVVEETFDAIKIGASVTLMEFEKILRHHVERKPKHKTRIFSEIIAILHFFAGKQIRNVAGLGGNIMTGSPISDLNPLLMASGAKFNLASSKLGIRTVIMDRNFFTGYRRNVVAPNEVLLSIEIPFTDKDQYFVAYKQARRRDDDIAIVNMALNVRIMPSTNIIRDAKLSYGGMAPTTVLAIETCRCLIGKKWEQSLLQTVYDALLKELPLPDSVPGGMMKYRRSLTLSLFFKAFLTITNQLDRQSLLLPEELMSATRGFDYVVPKSSQYYQVVPKDQAEKDLVGRPIVHASAYKQATGEAVYCDDLSRHADELYLALVLSTRAHAKILKIDAEKAMAMDGVVAFYSAYDLPEKQRWHGPVVHDEEVFASEKVTSHGQVIGAIVAVNQLIAQKAARAVYVEYEDIDPIIISIEDAIEHGSFYPGTPKRIQNGDSQKAFSVCPHVIEGEVRIGGQEHFYLETHAALAIPREADELEIFCSTQHPSEIQKLVAHALNIHASRVVVKAKRLGGGFGGKESRAAVICLPVALAAHKLGKPVRCMLDRDEDMMITGTRHPFLFKYKVGFDNDGLIKVIQVFIYCNAGYSCDLSISVLERAMFHVENSYKIQVSDVHGYACKTNLPSNTAFRGFGGPQGMFAAETIIRHIAEYLNLDVVKLSEQNLYKEGDLTHYNQKLLNCTVSRCWTECLLSSDYSQRLSAIQTYNRNNRYKKRGLSVVPTKFGIAFTALFLNQAGALVHVYTDGSVLLSHGGIEMGQGLHTKMIQVASRSLRVEPEKIYIMETSTDKVPNTSATAASAGSDLNGMAVMNACNEIMKRLKPVIEKNPKGTWESWVATAYMERISLSATGFYRTPDIGYSFETNSGNPFNYFTYGVACSEVEIDCLTGDHQVLRSDIVMDLGESLNPAIDIGQVEGGFIQGYGLLTLEEMIYLRNGTLASRGPGAYKLPGFTDIPQVFNVSLLKGASNPRAVYSSKAVGEPPLFLASSVFFAIREAVKSAREEIGLHDYFQFDAPATAARIRLACVDELTMMLAISESTNMLMAGDQCKIAIRLHVHLQIYFFAV